MRSRFNLEPVNVSFAIFKLKCRMLFNFWKTIGYLIDDCVADDDNVENGYKPRNYHAMLELILQDVLGLQTKPDAFNNFPLRIGNHVHYVNIRFPVAFVISDTQGADKLCGRYISYSIKVQRLHRLCTCKATELTSVGAPCEWVNMSEMMDVIDRGDKGELSRYSQHRIPDHAFRYIDFGRNKHGIYAATPNDILHGIKLGVIHYALDVFLTNELTPAVRDALEQAVKLTLPHLKQGGNRKFPRIYFPNGVTNLNNTTADENVGVMFMLFIVSVTTQGRKALQTLDRLSIARINQYRDLFERLLTFLLWLSGKKNGYWKRNDTLAMKAASKRIANLITFICTKFERTSGQGWNLSKMHELLHVTRLINMFGAPSNYDAGPGERMHKDFAKKPGRASQKRHETFTFQAANRLADRYLIDLAYANFVPTTNSGGADEQEKDATTSGSSFHIKIGFASNANGVTKCQFRAIGQGKLAKSDLRNELYPGIVEYIVSYFVSNYDDIPTYVPCASKYYDKDDMLYRAHHSF